MGTVATNACKHTCRFSRRKRCSQCSRQKQGFGDRRGAAAFVVLIPDKQCLACFPRERPVRTQWAETRGANPSPDTNTGTFQSGSYSVAKSTRANVFVSRNSNLAVGTQKLIRDKNQGKARGAVGYIDILGLFRLAQGGKAPGSWWAEKRTRKQ